jgi:spore cortex biosynthesis protein YabQ
MFFVSSGQLLIFLSNIFGGIVIGIIYDTTRVFGAAVSKNRVAAAVADIIFVTLSTVVFIATTYISSFCEIRLYNIAGFFVGFAAERPSLKIFVAKLIKLSYNYIYKLIDKTKKYFTKIRAKRRGGAAEPAVRGNDGLSFDGKL